MKRLHLTQFALTLDRASITITQFGSVHGRGIQEFFRLCQSNAKRHTNDCDEHATRHAVFGFPVVSHFPETTRSSNNGKTFSRKYSQYQQRENVDYNGKTFFTNNGKTFSRPLVAPTTGKRFAFFAKSVFRYLPWS